MQPLARADLISIFDLEFPKGTQLPPLAIDKSRRENSSPIIQRLQASCEWLFYDDQLFDFDLIDLSKKVPKARGAVLRVNRKSRVGTFMIWRIERNISDPDDFKSRTWDQSNDDLDVLSKLCDEPRIERYYPFLAIQAETSDLQKFTSLHAEELGRLLTGDLEGERSAVLCSYVEEDLSLRSYEKLFLRWTDALAVYSQQIEEEKYENCVFRALQVFEHCILARVSLLTLSARADHLARRLWILTPGKWFESRRLFASFSSTEEAFVMYPRVQSVEADRMISAAHKKFGIERVASAAEARKTELQEQLQWAKAQTLGLLALLSYLFDKIGGWDYLKASAGNAMRHLFR